MAFGTGKLFSIEQIIGALLVGLVIGALLFALWTTKKDASENVVITPSKEASLVAGVLESQTTKKELQTYEKEALHVSSDTRLEIADQSAGLLVVVHRAALSENEWLVIHEDRGGLPSNALGAARFIGGARAGTVELLRGTTPGGMYHALVYRDDGDGIFSLERDAPVRDTNGNPLLVTFKTL